MVPQLVGKEELTNAIALNSSVFHGTRVWGPTIAGILLGPMGTGGCFYLTSVGYLGIIGALLLMKMPPGIPRAIGQKRLSSQGNRRVDAVRAGLLPTALGIRLLEPESEE